MDKCRRHRRQTERMARFVLIGYPIRVVVVVVVVVVVMVVVVVVMTAAVVVKVVLMSDDLLGSWGWTIIHHLRIFRHKKRGN